MMLKPLQDARIEVRWTDRAAPTPTTGMVALYLGDCAAEAKLLLQHGWPIRLEFTGIRHKLGYLEV